MTTIEEGLMCLCAIDDCYVGLVLDDHFIQHLTYNISHTMVTLCL